MAQYIFVKGDYFNGIEMREGDREGLSRAAERPSPSFAELEMMIIPYNAHIGKSRDELPHNFTVHTLPLTINRLPVWYEHPAGNQLIGNVEVVERGQSSLKSE